MYRVSQKNVKVEKSQKIVFNVRNYTREYRNNNCNISLFLKIPKYGVFNICSNERNWGFKILVRNEKVMLFYLLYILMYQFGAELSPATHLKLLLGSGGTSSTSVQAKENDKFILNFGTLRFKGCKLSSKNLLEFCQLLLLNVMVIKTFRTTKSLYDHLLGKIKSQGIVTL